jgi:putative membrane protein
VAPFKEWFVNLVKIVPKDRGTVLAEERTDLALRRTMIAAERTLMAWIRTALSMIGFGFSIYKFFQYLPEEIVLGTLALCVAVWQHRNFLSEIGASRMPHAWSLSLVVAIVVILIGFITFYGVLLRHGPF